jgi:hypothetical protein
MRICKNGHNTISRGRNLLHGKLKFWGKKLARHIIFILEWNNDHKM